MKTPLILLFVLFLANVLLAQSQTDANTSGLYVAKEDFLGNQAHHIAKNDDQNFIRIRPNQTIVLKRGPERTKFKFNDVYGYSSNGERYRKFGEKKLFHKCGYAKVLDDRSLTLYSAYYADYKIRKTHYFYSLSPESPLRYLSKRNLRKDLPDNKTFLHLIKGLNHRKMISHSEGKYLLSELYEKSLNEWKY